MTPTPVGMRCPECSRERTKVKTIRTITATPDRHPGADRDQRRRVHRRVRRRAHRQRRRAAAPCSTKGALFGPAIVHQHEYWRIVTSGFLHDSVLHIAFNMFFLYVMGMMLEPAIGHVNFAALYFTSLLAGSFGALLFSPGCSTVGASGACFGVLGGADRRRARPRHLDLAERARARRC